MYSISDIIIWFIVNGRGYEILMPWYHVSGRGYDALMPWYNVSGRGKDGLQRTSLLVLQVLNLLLRRGPQYLLLQKYISVISKQQ